LNEISFQFGFVFQLNWIRNCIFNCIGIGHGLELGYGFGWEMEWIGIGHVFEIGWEFGFEISAWILNLNFFSIGKVE
jgi:hypothetical protein